MKVAVFSSKPYDEEYLLAANQAHGHSLSFLEARLTRETVQLAEGYPAVCCFVNDDLGGEVLAALHRGGTRLLALRSAGFNHVDLGVAASLGLSVGRVPAYSPYAVAEHAVGLLLSLNRKIHRAYARVREHNFALNGLLGFDVRSSTVGVIGTGKIGTVFATIMAGFGCRVLASDPFPNDEVRRLGAEYVDLDTLLAGSDIVALHCPLTPQTQHLLDARAFALMKDDALLVNTSRGALVDTQALVDALKARRIGAVALDVYEEEGDLFFEDLSDRIVVDDVFSRLLTFPNVLITSHQAFFTREALAAIAETTLANVSAFDREGRPEHAVGQELRGRP